MIFYFSLLVLIFILGASLTRRSFGVNVLRRAFWLSVLIVFVLLFYQSYLQYRIWFSDGLSKYLLNQSVDIGWSVSVNYFIYYVFMRFFAPYLVSLIAAFLFFQTAKILNKKYEERFFEPEELWLGALALFLTGWPGSLFYFIGLILIYLIIHILLSVVSRRLSVVSLYYWWLLSAIFVIIINKWLVESDLWKLLKI